MGNYSTLDTPTFPKICKNPGFLSKARGYDFDSSRSSVYWQSLFFKLRVYLPQKTDQIVSRRIDEARGLPMLFTRVQIHETRLRSQAVSDEDRFRAETAHDPQTGSDIVKHSHSFRYQIQTPIHALVCLDFGFSDKTVILDGENCLEYSDQAEPQSLEERKPGRDPVFFL